MARAAFRRAAPVLLALLFSACGESGSGSRSPVDPGNPAAEVRIEIRSQAGSPRVFRAEDGATSVECVLELTAAATGTPKAEAEWQDATLDWFLGTDRSTPATTSRLTASDVHGFWGHTLHQVGQQQRGMLLLRAQGTFAVRAEFRYRINGATEIRSASTAAECGPPLPPGHFPGPEFTHLSLSSQPLQAGDSIGVRYAATAAATLRETVITLRGTWEAEQRIDEGGSAVAGRTVWFRVPPGRELGSRLEITARAVDVLGQETVSAPLRSTPLVDLTPPAFLRVTTRLGLNPGEMATMVGQYAPGDTLSFWFTAADNHALGSFVYELGPPAGVRDSIPLHGAFVSGEWVRIPIRAGWEGSPRLRVYIRDQVGLKGPEYTSLPDSIRIIARATPLTRTATVASPAGDAVVDWARERVFLALPERNRVAVLSLRTMEVEAEIHTSTWPGAIDLTRGGDSLAILLPQDRSVAVVPVTPSIGAPVRLPLTDPEVRTPQALRVGADGAALVAFYGIDRPTGVLRLDLATGEQRLRTDIGTGVTPYITIARSGDHSRMIVLTDCAYIYRVAEDRFGPCRPATGIGHPAMDRTGQRVVRGLNLFDGDLNPIRTLSHDLAATMTSGLSPDGSTAWISTVLGLLPVRVADGSSVTRLDLPPIYGRIMADPSGSRLVLVNADPGSPTRSTQVLEVRLP